MTLLPVQNYLQFLKESQFPDYVINDYKKALIMEYMLKTRASILNLCIELVDSVYQYEPDKVFSHNIDFDGAMDG